MNELVPQINILFEELQLWFRHEVIRQANAFEVIERVFLYLHISNDKENTFSSLMRR